MPANGAAASYGDLLVTSLIVLGAVCVAAFALVRLVGRFLATGRVRGAHLLDVVARVPLEPRRSLYVVEVAGKTLLVGTSEMGLSVLSELDGGEVRARVASRPSFGDLVRAAFRRRRGLRGDGEAGGAGEHGGGGSAADRGTGQAAGGAAGSGAGVGVEDDRGAAADAAARGRAGPAEAAAAGKAAERASAADASDASPGGPSAAEPSPAGPSAAGGERGGEAP
jgi:flagellar biogenesis protein FliO